METLAVEIVTSVAFNLFKREELNLKEVKNFTAKNIINNIKTMLEAYEK